MYTVESVKRRIRTMGVHSFIVWISEANFSEDDTKQLEAIHILRRGFPSLSAIYSLARE